MSIINEKKLKKSKLGREKTHVKEYKHSLLYCKSTENRSKISQIYDKCSKRLNMNEHQNVVEMVVDCFNRLLDCRP